MKGKIFNAQEVQAIIAGTKTMFREVIKPYPILSNDKSYWEFKGVIWAGENSSYAKNFGDNARPEMFDLCSYQVGQEIFVKESFNIFASQVSYKQGLVGAERYFWRPAQYMKQAHSRLTLEITDIKVERLKEIDIKDVYKEGLPNHRIGQTFMWFEEHWNATHKKPEEKFEANPFCWVVDFKIK